jgi:hypothetical protein
MNEWTTLFKEGKNTWQQYITEKPVALIYDIYKIIDSTLERLKAILRYNVLSIK